MHVEFHKHNLQSEDICKLHEVLDSLFLTTGPVTREFEEAFAGYTELSRIVAVNSCTAAMHLALLALGIGPGDEVITTPLTFVATALAIEHTGASPVFVDVERETGLMDPSLVEKAITKKTKAILPVHLYGTMVDMRSLREIADRHGLFLVEDAAHCIEGERDGIRPGHLSDAVCYSFYATKNLTCGEGGAIGLREASLDKELRSLRTHGMTSDAASRHGALYCHWDVPRRGWKYNLDSIHSALLIRQLDRLNGYWEQRNFLWETYKQAFDEIEEVRLPQIRGKGAFHLMNLWVPPSLRDSLLSFLGERHIGCGVHYRAVHTLEAYKKLGYDPEDYPVAYELGQSCLSLPLYSRLTEEQLSYVVEKFKEGLRSLAPSTVCVEVSLS